MRDTTVSDSRDKKGYDRASSAWINRQINPYGFLKYQQYLEFFFISIQTLQTSKKLAELHSTTNLRSV